MSLTWRISANTGDADANADAEDYFGSSLGVIFPDDVTNQHGVDEHSLRYTSPHLPRPLVLELADPTAENDRKLFSHYLWNASLLLAEFLEADSLGVPLEAPRTLGLAREGGGEGGKERQFDVRGLDTLELGCGTALPSIMAALLGARRVAVTDYPAEPVMRTLRANMARNVRPALAPGPAPTPDAAAASEREAEPGSGSGPALAEVVVEGHSWGALDDPFSAANAHAFDRILAADCFWMPWQHANLHLSVAHFLRRGPDARAWAVGGFHTGRAKLRGFFDADALAAVGLEVEHIWERDCNGVDRPWDPERDEDVTVMKRWLVIASLKWA